MWAGAMVAFYWSVIAFIFLMFDYISYAFPDALTYFPADPYQSGISYEMASIIVMVPLFLLLMRFIRKDIARDSSRKEIWVRRWALILTLFVAGVAMAGDLITLLTTFLNGEALTLNFLLKVGVIFLVAALVFMHFIADLGGYWDAYPLRKRFVVIAVAILAVLAIGSGFIIVGTPYQARLARFDAQRVADLQNIQSQVTSYFQAKRTLPVAIGDLTNMFTLSYQSFPVDPETSGPYVYEATGKTSFKLCAQFKTESRPTSYRNAEISQPIGENGVKARDNWQHGSGSVCFDRVIDPSFYPPLK